MYVHGFGNVASIVPVMALIFGTCKFLLCGGAGCINLKKSSPRTKRKKGGDLTASKSCAIQALMCTFERDDVHAVI